MAKSLSLVSYARLFIRGDVSVEGRRPDEKKTTALTKVWAVDRNLTSHSRFFGTNPPTCFLVLEVVKI